MKQKNIGTLNLVLHAHLPYVRHAGDPHALEQRWLFEAITETYIPLLDMFTRLANDAIPVNITMSLTPPLISMLLDPLLQQRYQSHLESLMELAGKELQRTERDPQFHPLAQAYDNRLRSTLAGYTGVYRKDLVSAFVHLADHGIIELIASCATHGFLPILGVNESSAEAQIGIGMDFSAASFKTRPNGFWLPECGYCDTLDPILKRAGVRYTFLDAHGIRNADPQPVYDVYAPLMTPGGIIAFARDPLSSHQVWSTTGGYPGDPQYREYYKDIGHELELDYIRPYIHPEGIRVDTGIKYWRITGGSGPKEPYNIDAGRQKAAYHARDFLEKKAAQCTEAATRMDRIPLITAPFDAELFGHWWHEGPVWLEALIRAMHAGGGAVRPVTPPQYLADFPICQLSRPSASTWGQNGYNEFWLNPDNDWVCRAVHGAGARMKRVLAQQEPAPSHAVRRALDQAARELLLTEASDWPFILKTGTTVAYATRRITQHLDRFNRICDSIELDSINALEIGTLENEDPIFPAMNCAEYYRNPAQRMNKLRNSVRPAPRHPKSRREGTAKMKPTAVS